MSHYDAAIYTARRLEMCEIVEMTLFYFIDRPQVHLALSGLPFMVSTLVIYWVLRSKVWAYQEVSVSSMCTESMTICYCIIIMWCLFLASFWFSVIANSREPFSMTCPIGTSSLAFVRVTRIFSIVRGGFIRGGRQFTCLMTISSSFLLQRICFEESDLKSGLCFIISRATNLWTVYQMRKEKF